MDENKIYSLREIIYLTVLTGADQLYGYFDSWSMESKGEIIAEAENIRSKLIESGALSMDFNGDLAVEDSVLQIISTIGNCDICIMPDIAKDDKTLPKSRYYISKNSIAAILAVDDGYQLKLISKEELMERINILFDHVTDISQAIVPFRIKRIDLEKAKAAEEKAQRKKKLMECHADDITADIISSGLSGEAGIYTVSFVSPKDYKQEQVFVISTDKGSVSMDIDAMSPDEMVTFAGIDKKEARAKASAYLTLMEAVPSGEQDG